MKTIGKFTTTMLLAAMLPAAIGCSEDSSYVDDPTDTAAGRRVTVTVTCQAPVQQLQSRSAIGDGSYADILYYALYEVSAANADTLTLVETNVPGYGDKSVDLSYTFIDWDYGTHQSSVKLPLNVEEGKSYKMAFFAESGLSPYFFNPETGIVTADYTGIYNPDEIGYNKYYAQHGEIRQFMDCDENQDAFSGSIEFTATSNMQKRVELKRPFANLIVVCTCDYYQNDEEKEIVLGYISDAAASGLTVSSAYTQLDLLTGDVSGAVSNVGFVVNTSYTLSYVASSDYWWSDQIPMIHGSYILVNDVSEQENFSVGFNFYSSQCNVDDISLECNYRTTITLSNAIFAVPTTWMGGGSIIISRKFLGTYDVGVE